MSLSRRADGKLVLLAAQASIYQAWEVVPDEAGTGLSFTGAYSGTGEVIDHPFLGSGDLLVPVVRNQGLVFDRLDQSVFSDSVGAPGGL